MFNATSISNSDAARRKLLDCVHDHEAKVAKQNKPKDHARIDRYYSTPTARKIVDVSSSSAKGSPLMNLPNEILQAIADHLDVTSLTRLRLMCSRLADLCAPDLFKDGFSIRPYRDDMIRLAKVCLVPQMAKGIKSVTIYMGDMSKIQFIKALRSAAVSRPRNPMAVLQKLFNPKTLHCNKDLLETCFSLLPSLDSITAESHTSPFLEPSYEREMALEYFDRAWEEMEDRFSNYDRNHFLDSKISVDRYTSLLLSTLDMPGNLTTLNLDALPIDCFARDLSHLRNNEDFHHNALPIEVNTELLKSMQKAVSGIQDLDVGIIGSGRSETVYSGEKIGQAIGSFMGAMKNLRSLSIEWEVEEDVDEACIQAWNKSFCNVHFEHLQDLRIVNLETPRILILQFIRLHASTLKRLVWSAQMGSTEEEAFWMDGSEYETPSWREVFTGIKESMPHLTACELQDDCDPQQLYVGGFKPVTLDPRIKVPIPKLLEMYVLGKMPWPMKGDNPDDYRGWKPKHSPCYEEFCAYTSDQLEYFYSDEWETDEEGMDSSDGHSSESVSDDFGDNEDDDEDDFSDEDDNLANVVMGPGLMAAMMQDADDDGWEDEMDTDTDTDDNDEFLNGFYDVVNRNAEMAIENMTSEELMAAMGYGHSNGEEEMD